MRALWSARWFRLLVVAAPLLLTSLAICWSWRIWSPADYRSYQTVIRYALGEDLWFGRIRPGDELESVMARAQPHSIESIGRFTCVAYYPGGPPEGRGIPMERLSIVAKDGRLVSASASCCVWCREFFQMNHADRAFFSKTYQDYVREEN
jgi:hypothetical protein